MWIRYEHELQAPMTNTLRNLIAEAEELDAAQSLEYFAVADAIDVLCKRYRTNGFYTQRDWDDVCYKYPGEEIL